MRIFQYWGKAQEGWHLLPFHSLDVAACAVVLLERRPFAAQTLTGLTGLPQDTLSATLGAAAALHDLGKLSPGFQNKVPDVVHALGKALRVCPDDVRHDSLGWVLWSDKLRGEFLLGSEDRRYADVWIQAATGHHGLPPSRTARGGLPVRIKQYFTDEDIEAAREWMLFVRELFRPDWSRGDLGALKSASWWIAGLITLADWLGSSTEWFSYRPDPCDLSHYWRAAIDKAEVAVRESGLGEVPTRRTFSDLFPAYQPTPVQAAATDLPPDEPFLLVVEETTGGGKTECAIAAAGGDAFFFGLPTMATANGLWARISGVSDQQALIHSKRWLLPDAMGRAASWLNDSSRKALLANVGVGTVDQAMMAVLRARFNALRLFGLAGRTLIIDEVHAYDPYMTGVLERLVEFHARAGGNVVLLSATMSLNIRQALADAWGRGRGEQTPALVDASFPLISRISSGQLVQRPVTSYRSRRLAVRYAHEPSACISTIRDAVAQGQCVAWIRNTVREAIETFDVLEGEGLAPLLFHARFAQGDRLAIEGKVLRTFGKSSTPDVRRGKVLVATQIIEQSLDLDFDLLVTDLAPVDLLIQRAGRLQRHERGQRSEPTLLVHSPPWDDAPPSNWIRDWSSGAARVYPDHGRLWLTQRALGNEMVLPDRSRDLVEAVYGPNALDAIPVGLVASAESARATRNGLALAAGKNLVGRGSPYAANDLAPWTDEEAPTRLGERSREWVICESGVPVREDVERSVVALRGSTITRAPAVTGLDVGSWRRSINLTGGVATCEGLGGQRLSVRYDPRRGLTWTT